MPELDKLRVIDKAFAESRLSWSRVRRLCEVATPQTESAWMEKALVVTQDELDRLVLARDGHACANCKSRRGLHAHHVQWRSKGRSTTPSNLVALGARCHSLVHGGFLLVEVAQCATPATPFPSCDTRGLAAIHGSSLTAWTRPAPS